MAINTSRLENMAGNDEVVANQRVRAYVPGDPFSASVAGDQQYGTLWMQGTGVALNLSAGSTGVTITAAQLGGGIIVQTPSAAVTWTLDSASAIQTYMNNNSAGINVGDILVCDVINAQTQANAANTITISPGASGGFDTGQTQLQMPGGTSRTLFIRMTAVGSSPAYVCYG